MTQLPVYILLVCLHFAAGSECAGPAVNAPPADPALDAGSGVVMLATKSVVAKGRLVADSEGGTISVDTKGIEAEAGLIAQAFAHKPSAKLSPKLLEKLSVMRVTPQLKAYLNATLESLKPIFTTIIEGASNDTALRDSIYVGFSQIAQDLNKSKVVADGQETTTVAARNTHIKCRQAEAVLLKQKNTCGKELSVLTQEVDVALREVEIAHGTKKSTLCPDPTALSKFGIDDYKTLEDQALEIVNKSRAYREKEALLKIKKTECLNISSGHATKRLACTSEQRGFEVARCQQGSTAKTSCKQYTSSYSTTLRDYNAVTSSIAIKEDDRKMEWQHLKRIECIIEAIVDATTDGDLKSNSTISKRIETCSVKAFHNSGLDIDDKIAPEPEVCLAVPLLPCTQTFVQTEYADVLPFEAPAATCENGCAATTTTTVTTTMTTTTTITSTSTAAPAGCTKLSTLAENNFNDRGDETLNPSSTYTYLTSCGYDIRLTGWTHTRTYAKGFLRNTPGVGKAVVDGLAAGRAYTYKIYQYADSSVFTNEYLVNGVSQGTTTSIPSDAATATGQVVPGRDGRVVFTFIRQSGHVHLSAIAIAEAACPKKTGTPITVAGNGGVVPHETEITGSVCSSFSDRSCPSHNVHPLSGIDDGKFGPGRNTWLSHIPAGFKTNTDPSVSLDITYAFTSPVVVTKYKLWPRTSHKNQAPQAWTLYSSMDKSNWKPLDTQTGQKNGNTWPGGVGEFDVQSSSCSLYLKLSITQAGNYYNGQVSLAEWAVYGHWEEATSEATTPQPTPQPTPVVTVETFSDARCTTPAAAYGGVHKTIYHKVPGSTCFQMEYFKFGETGSATKGYKLDGKGKVETYVATDCTGTPSDKFPAAYLGLGLLRCPSGCVAGFGGTYAKWSGTGFDPDTDVTPTCA